MIPYKRDFVTLNKSVINYLQGVHITYFTKWLKDSGLVVNETSRQDIAPVRININGCEVRTKKTISVLGLVFNSKLTWDPQVASTVAKSMRALNALRLISRFFSTKELTQLVTSNVYSILFYNSEVWCVNNIC